MKKINIGVVAHVDAGKTTFCECLFEICGLINKRGRVDHKDAFFDYDLLEKKRGITIFSKEAVINYEDLEITLLDTPGHFDFSSEMERTLQILDYAIIIINSNNGVQNHTRTLWKLLNKYNIKPIFFCNKMDSTFYSEDYLIESLENLCNSNVVNFTNMDNEKIAYINDELMEHFICNNNFENYSFDSLFKTNDIIPCFFGSALNNTGVIPLLDFLNKQPITFVDDETLKYYVYKISFDKNIRLTHVFIKSGILKVKDKLNDEKINEIRKYNGIKYLTLNEVHCNQTCTLVGLNSTYIGQSVGFDNSFNPEIKACMKYSVISCNNVDIFNVYEKFKILQQEDPLLLVNYDHSKKFLCINAMGEIHLEILKHIFVTRFNYEIDFIEGEIIYLETIIDPVIGYGHYEPLKHYAEVHIKIMPLNRGEGIRVSNNVNKDLCPIQYIKQIEKYLLLNEIPGVLNKSKLTDIEFVILAAKGHETHTSSGDFIEATKRAVRNGLLHGNNVLLEPFVNFVIKIQPNNVSSVLFELEKRASCYEVSSDDLFVTITGDAPLFLMHDFQRKIQLLSCIDDCYSYSVDDYKVCRNQVEILKKYHYNPLEDIEFTGNSIFCNNGSGFSVKYDVAKNHMHMYTNYQKEKKDIIEDVSMNDLEKIFERTYGKVERKQFKEIKKVPQESGTYKFLPSCVVIDGYNLMHELFKSNNETIYDFNDAREKLIDIVADYQGYRECLVIVVFDAHKVSGGIGSKNISGNFHLIYTKEAQSADMYIESITGELAKEYNVTVVTSDALQQIIVFAKGANRQSSREFLLEYKFFQNTKLKEYTRVGIQQNRK